MKGRALGTKNAPTYTILTMEYGVLACELVKNLLKDHQTKVIYEQTAVYLIVNVNQGVRRIFTYLILSRTLFRV